MRAIEIFGKIYVTVMVLSSLIPIYFTFQFYIASPEIRIWFYLLFIVPITGIGVGVYGLIKTKDEVEEVK